MSKIRVFIVDDHPIVRSGIRNLIEQAGDISVVGEANGGEEALSLIETLDPDVLLLDMEMPGMSGSVVAQRLQLRGSPVKILALSGHDDKEYIQEVLAHGAKGYLVKDEIPEVIVDAIRGVARGENGWVSRSIAAQMTSWIQDDAEGVRIELTPREKQVIKMVAEGLTNQDIGLQLGISEKTVEKHLYGIFSKLSVNSRVEAAVVAVREGWV